jgi:hypothetical protein
MEYNYFNEANLLVLKKNGKLSLYRMHEDQSIEPLEWAQNQQRLEVYPEHNLVLTDSVFYQLNGKRVMTHVEKDEVSFIPMKSNLLVKMENFQTYLFWWNGRKVINTMPQCKEVYYNENYVVTKTEKDSAIEFAGWIVYDDAGKEVLRTPIPECDVKLVGNFLITDGLAHHDVCHLPTSCSIIEGQQRVVVSPYDDFAMCCHISGNLQVWSHGKWLKDFGAVEDFGLLSEDFGVFYTLQNGKYHLYNFDGRPLLQPLYPNGLDYVGYNADDMGAILINNGKADFYM